MHKNKPVLDLVLDEHTSSISVIGDVHSKEHIPVGIPLKKGKVDRASLNGWWQSRSIPASRDGIHEALTKLNITRTEKLLEKSFGLSLSDQYWIAPSESNIRWDDVNFFENSFSKDVGNVLFGENIDNKKIDLMSPDNTSDGWLKKKWEIIDGKRCLIKGGSGATQQEPYNEVFASEICKKLGIDHIPYSLMEQESYPYSVCENFVTPETELISAYMSCKRKRNKTMCLSINIT